MDERRETFVEEKLKRNLTTERTKLVILIVSQTIVIGFDHAIEAVLEKSTEIDLKTFVSMLLNLLLYTMFGFFTENAKKLFIYSTIIALVNIIFASSNMYFNPNEYQKTLTTFDNSVFIFLTFGFALMLIISLVFMGLGMVLSHLFQVIFKKQAGKF